MFPWLFQCIYYWSLYLFTFQINLVRELGLSGRLYADDLVLCGESEEDLRAMVGSFVGV